MCDVYWNYNFKRNAITRSLLKSLLWQQFYKYCKCSFEPMLSMEIFFLGGGILSLPKPKYFIIQNEIWISLISA